MIPLHEELKKIRLERGVSIEDIHNATKIRIDFIEKLEEGDFGIVPKPYLRAFLREYAEVVGIDPEYVMARLESRDTGIPEKREERGEPRRGEGETGEEAEHAGEAADGKPGEKTGNVPVETAERTAANLLENEITKRKTDTARRGEKPRRTATPGGAPPQGDEKAAAGSGTDDENTHGAGENRQPDLFDPTPTGTKPYIAATGTTPQTLPAGPGAPGELAATAEPHRRLTIDESDSGGKLFFVLFVILLVTAAAVIVWLNRSGMF